MSDERTPELNIDEKYSERLEYLGRIAALEGALKVAQDTIEHAERWATHKNDKQFFQSAKERIEAALGGK